MKKAIKFGLVCALVFAAHSIFAQAEAEKRTPENRMGLRVGAYGSYLWAEEGYPYHIGVLSHSISISPIPRLYCGIRWTQFGVWGDFIRSEKYFAWEPYGQYFVGINDQFQFFGGVGFRMGNFAQVSHQLPFRRPGQLELSISGGADIQLWKQLRMEIGFVTNPVLNKQLGQYGNNYPFIGLDWQVFRP